MEGGAGAALDKRCTSLMRGAVSPIQNESGQIEAPNLLMGSAFTNTVLAALPIQLPGATSRVRLRGTFVSCFS